MFLSYKATHLLLLPAGPKRYTGVRSGPHHIKSSNLEQRYIRASGNKKLESNDL